MDLYEFDSLKVAVYGSMTELYSRIDDLHRIEGPHLSLYLGEGERDRTFYRFEDSHADMPYIVPHTPFGSGYSHPSLDLRPAPVEDPRMHALILLDGDMLAISHQSTQHLTVDSFAAKFYGSLIASMAFDPKNPRIPQA